jgi:hypothetical protein
MVLGVGVALSLATSACGSGGKSADTTEPATVTEATTTKTTEVSGTGDTGTAVSDSSSATGGPATTTKPKSSTTLAPASTDATSTTVKPHKLYDQLAAPILPTDHTPPVPASGPLPDGTYWVVYNGGDQATPDVDVYQAFFGDACVAEAAAKGDECLDDYYVLDTPTQNITTMPFSDDVVITVSDESTQKSYFVTPGELVKIRAGSPSAGAPAGYHYVPFPYLMRVRSGKITRFRQVWTP